MKRTFLFTLLFLTIASIAMAAPILDQESPASNATFNGSSPSINWQQEVVAGVNGLLSSVSLYAMATGSIDFYINLGGGWQSDADNLYLSGISLSSEGWNAIDVSAANLVLQAGDLFVLGIKGIDGGANVGGSAFPGLYSQGDLFLRETLYDNSNWDIAFQTYMDSDYAANPVPEPATLLLMGTGILGFAVLGRKIKKQ